MNPYTIPLLSLAIFAAGTASALLRDSEGWSVNPHSRAMTPRAAHQATLLDSSRILLTGGCSGVSCAPVERSTETLDGRTGQITTSGSMRVARVAHAAARMSDGRVLVMGGWTGSATTATAEAFDPSSQRFSPVPPMGTARMDATVNALADGTVLVVGGASATNRPLATAELFEGNRFEPVASMHVPRAHHASVRLSDGKVLVLGGQVSRGVATPTAEVFDPATRTFSRTGSLKVPRCKHAAVLLRDGRVMVIAGSSDCDERQRLAQTEIYDPSTGQFTAGPALIHPRYKIVSAAAVTREGQVIVAGDAGDVEVWTPGSNAFVKAVGTLGKNLSFSTVTALPDGTLVIAGGYDNDIRPTAETWLVTPNRAKPAASR